MEHDRLKPGLKYFFNLKKININGQPCNPMIKTQAMEILNRKNIQKMQKKNNNINTTNKKI